MTDESKKEWALKAKESLMSELEQYFGITDAMKEAPETLAYAEAYNKQKATLEEINAKFKNLPPPVRPYVPER